MTKTILVTGFIPFANHKENPSEKVATILNGQVIEDYQIHSLILPVSYEKSAKILIENYLKLKPKIVLSLGLASDRQKISIERIFINCNHGGFEADIKKFHEKIINDGPDAYFTNFPLKAFTSTLIPMEISNSAGTYVCNNISYQLLHFCSKNVEKDQFPKIGFVHLPFLNTVTFPYDKNQVAELTKEFLQVIIHDLTF
ncbi:MAG: hypothetical protein U0T83_09780 [Bacteriovoracaceae bacterium]